MRLPVLWGLMALLCVPAWAQGPNAQLERGRYLVEVVGHCGNCHASRAPDGQPIAGRGLAGGWVMQEGPMRAVVPNITPDRETGIGNWTQAQIIAAIREGRRPDGTPIGWPMPIDFYAGISDADVAAMAAYLRSVPPVRNAVAGRSSYPFPVPAHPAVASVPPPADNPVARGAYLAGPIAHCLDCHSGRGPDMRIIPGREGAQGLSFTGPWGTVVARNLTPSTSTGIGNWSLAQFTRALREEIGGDGRPLMPPMGRGRVWAAMTDRDIADLFAYFRSLPPLD
ncbi:c-type cytochrome [Sediminicoccus sp. KRV36]|uniref:c-type cytochrome n=1 Tax=Sediminicoccus sp. KRV36 TaxID=3133721 RepID=UPI002010A20A|nr:c-type cytochrome [Sediminicoccus rosea]UPY36778.1 cytochrome c [Sediminicoccus rosea]